MIHNDRFYKAELLILAALKDLDKTCDQIMLLIEEKTQNVFHIKKGILLTSLYYFEQASLITSYLKDGQTYFHMEAPGYVRLDTLKRDYYLIRDNVELILQDIEV